MNDSAKQEKQRFRDSALFPVVFMFAVTFVTAAVLIALVRSTQGKVDANQRIQFERAVLEAVGLDVNDDTSRTEIHELFTSRIQAPTEGGTSAYRFVEDDKLLAWALPIEGQGFWNVIRGVVGLSPDGSEMKGIAFYEQSETPGLGAEIVKWDRFRKRFVGRKLAAGDKPIVFCPEGTAETEMKEHQVHAITGATQTCTRLSRFLNEALLAWRRSSTG